MRQFGILDRGRCRRDHTKTQNTSSPHDLVSFPCILLSLSPRVLEPRHPSSTRTRSPPRNEPSQRAKPHDGEVNEERVTAPGGFFCSQERKMKMIHTLFRKSSETCRVFSFALESARFARGGEQSSRRGYTSRNTHLHPVSSGNRYDIRAIISSNFWCESESLARAADVENRLGALTSIYFRELLHSVDQLHYYSHPPLTNLPSSLLEHRWATQGNNNKVSSPADTHERATSWSVAPNLWLRTDPFL